MAIEDAITAAKDNLPNITPTPPAFHSQASAHELKSRLNWGEPGLTILDVRDRNLFNERRIMGAMSMPQEEISQVAESLSPKRDIYLYGATDGDTASAANSLRSAGFLHVAELKGGLAAWQEIDGPVEGAATNENPGSDAYNVSSRLAAFGEEKAKEKRMENRK